eukprot:SAG22_NODE_31_length_27697_cov_7.384376_4_plen_167_part_00
MQAANSRASVHAAMQSNCDYSEVHYGRVPTTDPRPRQRPQSAASLPETVGFYRRDSHSAGSQRGLHGSVRARPGTAGFGLTQRPQSADLIVFNSSNQRRPMSGGSAGHKTLMYRNVAGSFGQGDESPTGGHQTLMSRGQGIGGEDPDWPDTEPTSLLADGATAAAD